MGLIVNSTKENKIEILGLDGNLTEVSSIYVRIQFFCPSDGVTINGAFESYLSKDAFKKGAPMVKSTFGGANFEGAILDGKPQGNESAHDVALRALTDGGYSATIDL